MKRRCWLLTIVASALAISLCASEVDQLKADLIGHTMGGREKSWKFQSPDQIKDLVIRSRREDQQSRVYTIGLKLQAAQTGEKYAAEARVEYSKASTGDKIKSVGLLSLKKIE